MPLNKPYQDPTPEAPSALQRWLAGGTRVGASLFGGLGGWEGFGVGGLGEIAAEQIENPLHMPDWKRVGVEAGISAIPAAAAIKEGKMGLSALRGALMGGGGEAARQWSRGEDVDPRGIATAGVLGGAASGILSKFIPPLKMGATEAPVEKADVLLSDGTTRKIPASGGRPGGPGGGSMPGMNPQMKPRVSSPVAYSQAEHEAEALGRSGQLDVPDMPEYPQDPGVRGVPFNAPEPYQNRAGNLTDQEALEQSRIMTQGQRAAGKGSVVPTTNVPTGLARLLSPSGDVVAGKSVPLGGMAPKPTGVDLPDLSAMLGKPVSTGDIYQRTLGAIDKGIQQAGQEGLDTRQQVLDDIVASEKSHTAASNLASKDDIAAYRKQMDDAKVESKFASGQAKNRAQDEAIRTIEETKQGLEAQPPSVTETVSAPGQRQTTRWVEPPPEQPVVPDEPPTKALGLDPTRMRQYDEQLSAPVESTPTQGGPKASPLGEMLSPAQRAKIQVAREGNQPEVVAEQDRLGQIYRAEKGTPTPGYLKGSSQGAGAQLARIKAFLEGKPFREQTVPEGPVNEALMGPERPPVGGMGQGSGGAEVGAPGVPQTAGKAPLGPDPGELLGEPQIVQGETPQETPQGGQGAGGRRKMTMQALADALGYKTRKTMQRAFDANPDIPHERVGKFYHVDPEEVKGFLAGKAKKKGGGGGTTLGSGLGSFEALPGLVARNPQFALRLGLGAAGAGMGYATDPLGDPTESALAGGAMGAALPSVPGVLGQIGVKPEVMAGVADKLGTPGGIKEAAREIYHSLPGLQRTALLGNLHGLGANAFVGPWGGAMMGALEHHLAGSDWDTGGALRELANPMNFLKEYKGSYQEAMRLIQQGEMGRSEGGVGKIGGDLGAVLDTPANMMAAGDVAARNILTRYGAPEDLTRTITLTSEPELPAFKKTANFTKGSTGLQMLFPFTRTSSNVGEQGLQRVPGVGSLMEEARRNKGFAPTSFQHQVVKQGLGLAAGGAGYAAGDNVDPETGKILQRYVSNAGGMYSLPAGVGFAMGQAHQQGKGLGSTVGKEAAQNVLPVPSTEPINELMQLIFGNANGEHPFPRTFIPKDLANVLKGDSVGAAKDYPAFPRGTM